MDRAEAVALAPACKRATNLRAMVVLLVLVTIPVLVLDQASKHLVESHLRLYQSISVIPHWLDITYTRNPGAAFSLFVNLPPWLRASFLFSLSAVAIVALLILLAYSAELNTSLGLVGANPGRRRRQPDRSRNLRRSHRFHRCALLRAPLSNLQRGGLRDHDRRRLDSGRLPFDAPYRPIGQSSVLPVPRRRICVLQVVK